MHKREKLFTIVPIAAFFILIFTVIIMLLLASIPSASRDTPSMEYSDFSDNWYTDSNEPASLSHISGTYRIHHSLPASLQGQSLFFFAKTSNIRVFLDDECVYENTKYNSRFFGCTPGALFVQVPLYSNAEAGSVTIEVVNPYDDSSARIDELYIGNIHDIMMHQIQQRFPSFLLSIITIAAGLAIIILFIPLAAKSIIGREMLYLGAAAFISGIFMTADGRFIQLIYGNAHIPHVIAEISMQFMLPPFLMFIGHMYKHYNSAIAKILCLVYETVFILCAASQFLNYRDFHQNLFIIHGLFAISIAYILFYTIKGFIHQPHENTYHNVGCAGLCLLALTDIMLTWFGSSKETSFFVTLGILFFILMESVQMIHVFLQRYHSNIKNELLSRLAYHDGLTNLLNRTSYMEQIKALENEETPYLLFAIYDVNNLKRVNDTMGHQKGDEMIKKVADVLNSALAKYGNCYRIGGDEFVFISSIPGVEVDFKRVNSQIAGSFGSVSDDTSTVDITVAMGYSVLVHDAKRSVDDAIREADSKMYIHKRNMKKDN